MNTKALEKSLRQQQDNTLRVKNPKDLTKQRKANKINVLDYFDEDDE